VPDGPRRAGRRGTRRRRAGHRQRSSEECTVPGFRLRRVLSEGWRGGCRRRGPVERGTIEPRGASIRGTIRRPSGAPSYTRLHAPRPRRVEPEPPEATRVRTTDPVSDRQPNPVRADRGDAAPTASASRATSADDVPMTAHPVIGTSSSEPGGCSSSRSARRQERSATGRPRRSRADHRRGGDAEGKGKGRSQRRRPALFPCTKSVLQSHTTTATANDRCACEAITVR